MRNSLSNHSLFPINHENDQKSLESNLKKRDLDAPTSFFVRVAHVSINCSWLIIVREELFFSFSSLSSPSFSSSKGIRTSSKCKAWTLDSNSSAMLKAENSSLETPKCLSALQHFCVNLPSANVKTCDKICLTKHDKQFWVYF